MSGSSPLPLSSTIQLDLPTLPVPTTRKAMSCTANLVSTGTRSAGTVARYAVSAARTAFPCFLPTRNWMPAISRNCQALEILAAMVALSTLDAVFFAFAKTSAISGFKTSCSMSWYAPIAPASPQAAAALAARTVAYEVTAVSTTSPRSDSGIASSRPATTSEVTRRLRSHSHGPTTLSSKSLMPNSSSCSASP